MNNVSLNSSVYNRNQVSFQGAGQEISAAQKVSKTLVREAIKIGPAVSAGMAYPDPVQGAALGGLIKIACDAIGGIISLGKYENQIPTYMSELNIFKLGGRAIYFVSDQVIPATKTWGKKWL